LHRNLTPGTQIKLLGRVLSGALLVAGGSGLMAQDNGQGTYQGPGVSSPGVGTIGSRSGEQVDLRFFFGVSGVADRTNVPSVTDSKGNLVRAPELYGIEAQGGVYGVHSWKRSQLGLNYAGSYTRYLNSDAYNSTNHAFTLGYTDQLSRRLKLDLRQSLGSLTYGTGLVANAASTDLNTSFTPATRLFDSRTYYLESTVSATYLQSTRTFYTAGASTFVQKLQTEGLSDPWGYSFNGNMMRRLSKASTLGVTYLYSHFVYATSSSKADSQTFQGVYATGLGRFWTLSLEAGATIINGDGLITVTLNPVLAAVFGQPTITGVSTFRTTFPSGMAALKRQFKHASLGFNYYRGVNSGNGAYNTARLDNSTASFSYTGLRKVNMGVEGNYFKIKSIGQNIGTYSTYSAGAGATYALGRDMHLSLRYDYRDQQVDFSSYRFKGSRATIGLIYSPGSLPLSLW